MVYVYKENDIVKYVRDKRPLVREIIELERMIPMPVREGYIAVLNANFETKEVWYDLVQTEESKKKEEIAILEKELTEYDYIKQQWDEENDLNIPHHRTEEEYLLILKERQKKRERIRELTIELGG